MGQCGVEVGGWPAVSGAVWGGVGGQVGGWPAVSGAVWGGVGGMGRPPSPPPGHLLLVDLHPGVVLQNGRGLQCGKVRLDN